VWPLSRAKPRELVLWADLWAKPQAVAWEELGQEHEVAMYVRRLAEAEKPGAPVAIGTLIRQLSESLGLSVPGLARNKWRIGAPVEQVQAARAAAPQRTSARNRLQVVDGAGAS
jgi:hypothetical protein